MLFHIALSKKLNSLSPFSELVIKNPSLDFTIVGSYYESQSLNRFAYVNGNPISFIDSFGLERESDSKGKATWDKGMNVVQGVLGVVGFIPIFGEVADVTNGVISLGRGNYADAVANFASAIPVAGNGVAIGKAAYKAGDKISDINKAKKANIDCPINCFVAGTLVLTKEGYIAVEDIEVGDLVLAKDEKTGETSYKKVLSLFDRQAEVIYIISVGEEEISVTGEHPFWVEGKGWIETAYLEIGDILTTFDGQFLPIQDIIVKEEETTVYNFEVEDFHTYFVSKLGVWTHNCAKGGNGKVLGENLFKSMGLPKNTSRKGYQAQHLIQTKLKSHPVFSKIDFDMDEATNGIFLRDNKSGNTSATTRHTGKHPDYQSLVEEKLNSIDLNKSPNDIKKDVEEIQSKLRKMQENGYPIYKSQGGSLDNLKKWYDRM